MGDEPGATTEHEVKLGAPPGFVLPPLDGVVDGVTADEPVEQHLVADYYDTPTLRLTRAGLSLRFRVGDGSGWMVKVPQESGADGSLVRTEIAVPGPPGTVPTAAVSLVGKWTRDEPLEPVVRVDSRRRIVRLRDRGGSPVVELDDDDVTVVAGGEEAGRFRELEAEVVGDAPDGLLAGVVARLREAGAGAPSPVTKVARAIRLARPTVHAAGGVVWRPGADGTPEVLVVHRPKYDDWSLPKGKRDPGESDEACALREVEEETGVQGVLGPELPSTEYFDSKGRPKVVRYWSMAAAGGEFEPGDEVDEVRWLPVPAARDALSYDHDRAVVDAFAATAG